MVNHWIYCYPAIHFTLLLLFRFLQPQKTAVAQPNSTHSWNQMSLPPYPYQNVLTPLMIFKLPSSFDYSGHSFQLE